MLPTVLSGDDGVEVSLGACTRFEKSVWRLLTFFLLGYLGPQLDYIDRMPVRRARIGIPPDDMHS